MDRRIWNKDFRNRKNITASEIGTFAFCGLAFYLTRKFGVIQTERMKEGEYTHSPLILMLTKRALEEKGYGKTVYEGHTPGSPLLKNSNFNLIGKPDFITSSRKKGIIPVEVKSSNPPGSYPYKSHILQLSAYGLLCEENYSKPKLGLILYRSGNPVEIDVSKYRDECIQSIQFMLENADKEEIITSATTPGKKCGSCSQKLNCKFYSSQK